MLFRKLHQNLLERPENFPKTSLLYNLHKSWTLETGFKRKFQHFFAPFIVSVNLHNFMGSDKNNSKIFVSLVARNSCDLGSKIQSRIFPKKLTLSYPSKSGVFIFVLSGFLILFVLF